MSLLLALLLQTPAIDGVTTPSAGAARSGCWLPVEIAVRGPFDGVAGISTDVGQSFTRRVKVPAGATERILVPALVLFQGAPVGAWLRDGERVVAERRLDGGVTLLAQGDLLVGVVGGSPRVEELGGGRKAHCFPFVPGQWTEPALLESLDVIVGDPGAAPLGLFLAQGGRVVAGVEGLRDLKPVGGARFEAVDELVRPLLGSDPWIVQKRNAGALLLATYLASMLALLGWMASRGAKALTMFAAVGGLSTLFSAVAIGAFGGHTAATAWSARVGSFAVDVVCISGDTPGPREVTLGGLAKPLFASVDEAKRSEGRIEFGDGFSVAASDLKIPQAFLRLREAAPAGVTAKRGEGRSVELRNGTGESVEGWVLLDNLNSRPFRVAAGAASRIDVSADAESPSGADLRYFARRLVRGDCAFGWLSRSDRYLTSIGGADIADRRLRSEFFVVPVE